MEPQVVVQTVTRRARFNAAHALRGYEGVCGSVHGHNYELFVTLTMRFDINQHAFGIDISELSKVIDTHVSDTFDHTLILSDKGNKDQLYGLLKDEATQEQAVKLLQLLSIDPYRIIWFGVEPTTENLAFFCCKTLFHEIAALLETRDVEIQSLKCVLNETENNGAEISMVWGGNGDVNLE